jgi:membrane protein YdbS with pleckstrin-like domain
MTDQYSNQNVDSSLQPSIAFLDKQPLALEYAGVNLRLNLLIMLMLITLACALFYQSLIPLPKGLQSLLPNIILGLFAFTCVFCVYGYFSDKAKSYALRQLDLHYSSGLFFYKTVSQPITRIQHIELKRGPIERHFNLASLQIFSAGGATYSFEIPGLPVERAMHLRQFILQHRELLKHG